MGSRRKVSFASPPHGSGETAGDQPPEKRQHGGNSSGSVPSPGTDTLPPKKGVTFAIREQQSESGGHGGAVPMKEGSMTSITQQQQQQQQKQKQKQQQQQQKQKQPQTQPQPQPQPQPQRPVVIVPRYLYKLNGSPAEYETKFGELHPMSQQLVLKIQKRIREYVDESQNIDEYSRLYDSLGSGRYFEDDARYFNQQIKGLHFAYQREQILAEELRDVSIKILRATDVAVRSYTEYRNIFNFRSSVRASSVPTSTQMAWLPFPTASGFPFRTARPSSFMLKTVARFDEYLGKISQQIVELEQLVQPTSESSLQSIPHIMSNAHDFFIHVAAKVEKLHEHLDAMKKNYCATNAVLRR